MDSILLQKQVRDNSEELRNYLKELSSWEDEMKRKESSTTKNSKEKDSNSKKIKKQTDSNKKEEKKNALKIKSYDYKAWDNFDVDAECEKIDKINDGNKSESPEESSDSDYDPSEEYQQRLRDEATYEKERGNQFVKQQKWSDAISCYTHAIACYPKDPIYFANRALCHLKKDDLHSAEADCTSALRFDPNYVKALQRRAAARIGLKQYPEALDDLKKVLQLEPNNKESKKELVRIEKIIENKQSKSSTQNVLKYVPPPDDPKTKTEPKKIATILEKPAQNVEKTVEDKPKTEIKIPWPVRPNGVPIKMIQKLPHQRSKTPLHKINVSEITEGIENLDKPSTSKENTVPSKLIVKNDVSTLDNKIDDFVLPKSSVQFLKSWRVMRNDKNGKFEYLRRIEPERVPKIFQDAMESDIFGDILDVLQDKFVENGVDVFDYLKNLSFVKRFATLVMFMSANDKKALKKLFEYCVTKNIPLEEIDDLSKKYELY